MNESSGLTIQIMAKWIRQRTSKRDFSDAACLSWAEELYKLAQTSEYRDDK